MFQHKSNIDIIGSISIKLDRTGAVIISSKCPLFLMLFESSKRDIIKIHQRFSLIKYE